jgi:hypothetical protein
MSPYVTAIGIALSLLVVWATLVRFVWHDASPFWIDSPSAFSLPDRTATPNLRPATPEVIAPPIPLRYWNRFTTRMM